MGSLAKPISKITVEDLELLIAEEKNPAMAASFKDLASKLIRAMPKSKEKDIKLADRFSSEAKAYYDEESSQGSSESDVAFSRLIGAFTVQGSYPQKQAAMSAAVKDIPDGTAEELYDLAVKNLS